jgi:hypothetical protein
MNRLLVSRHIIIDESSFPFTSSDTPHDDLDSLFSSSGSCDCSTLLSCYRYFEDCRHATCGPNSPARAIRGTGATARVTHDPDTSARATHDTSAPTFAMCGPGVLTHATFGSRVLTHGTDVTIHAFVRVTCGLSFMLCLAPLVY